MLNKFYLSLVVITLSASAYAAPQTDQSITGTKLSHSSITDNQTAQYVEQAAKWSLTEKEWEHFEELKKGPRGYWSPNIDPLTALGMEAETDVERQRYAELQVKMEVARVDRELAYQRAYNAAFQRLYPSLIPIQGMSNNKPLMSRAASRISLFIKQDCIKCEVQVKKLQKVGSAFDVYVIDSQNKDDVIRHWAKKMNIQPRTVQSKQITLNHGEKLWKVVGNELQPLPAMYQQIDGQWVPVK